MNLSGHFCMNNSSQKFRDAWLQPYNTHLLQYNIVYHYPTIHHVCTIYLHQLLAQNLKELVNFFTKSRGSYKVLYTFLDDHLATY